MITLVALTPLIGLIIVVSLFFWFLEFIDPLIKSRRGEHD